MSHHLKSQSIVVRSRAMKKKQMSNGARKERKNVIPSIHRSESRTAKYYMFAYKIGSGRRPLTLKNAVYNYGPEECPNSFNGSGRCEDGSKCAFAHSWVEILFHPLFYKTKMCSKRKECVQGAERCAFAHSKEDFRILRQILGANWRACDPTDASGKRMTTTKIKVEKNRNTNRVPLAGSDCASVTSDSWSSRRSVNTGSVPSLVETLSNMSMSGVSEEEEKDRNEDNMAVVGDEDRDDEDAEEHAEDMSEFTWWFTNMFDSTGCLVEYLRRFEENGLDDFEFLWDLYRDDGRAFDDALVNVIGMADNATREVFGQTMCEYMNPLNVGEWMERVVGLWQYVDVFDMCGSVDELADMSLDDGALAEMGISSAGHRIKILFHLRQAREKIMAGRR